MPPDPFPQARSSGRPARTIRLPKRYQDELPPAPPIPIPDPEPVAEQTQESPTEKPELELLIPMASCASTYTGSQALLQTSSIA